jgi:histone acetyltransferase SAS3
MHIEHKQELDVIQGDTSLENQLLLDDLAGSDIDAEGEDDDEINTPGETPAAINTLERKNDDEEDEEDVEDDDDDEAAVESMSSMKSDGDEDDDSEESSESDAENEWEGETDAAEEVDAGDSDPNKCM